MEEVVKFKINGGENFFYFLFSIKYDICFVVDYLL